MPVESQNGLRGLSNQSSHCTRKTDLAQRQGDRHSGGPETSSNIRNAKGYADSNNMMLVSCCSSAPVLAIPNDSIFRLVPDYRNQGTTLAKLVQHEGIEVLVPVWRGDTWGDGLSEETTKSFVERGGLTDDGIRYNPESPKFSTSTSLLAEKIRGYVDRYGQDKVGIAFLGFAEVLQFVQSASTHDILDVSGGLARLHHQGIQVDR